MMVEVTVKATFNCPFSFLGLTEDQMKEALKCELKQKIMSLPAVYGGTMPKPVFSTLSRVE